MPVERSRGSRRTCADGNQLVWTEPSVAPGIAFATNLTPGAFEDSKDAMSSMTTKFAVEPPSTTPIEPKIEQPATPGPMFFFFDAPPCPPTDSKPKRASHKRKPTPPPASPASSPSSPGADAADSPPPTATHIPRPPNAFILFRSSFIRGGAVPADVEPSHSSLSAIAGLTWAALPPPEKEMWHRKAKEEREKHRERFPGYAFRPRYRVAPSSGSDADGEDGGGEGGGGFGESCAIQQQQTAVAKPRRRQQREVAPADRIRQAHIASLLLLGLKGPALNEAIAKFDQERKERGEGGVEVRFGVVETPEGRVEAGDAKCGGGVECEREGSPVVRRCTSKSEKRRTSSKTEGSKTLKEGKRRRIDTSPASLAAASPPPSSPSTPTDTEGETMSPFAFDFDSLSIPSTPIGDFTASFEWPPSSTSSPACFSPFDIPPSSPHPSFDSSYPPSPALSHSSASPSPSSWSSLEDLSNSLTAYPAPRTMSAPSPLSACSSMSSIGGDLSSALTSPTECINPLAVDLSLSSMSMCGSFSELDLQLGFAAFGDMGMGIDDGSAPYLTGYMDMEAPQVDAGIVAW
ncbi:HMG box domain-containing protein [Favolaschia claudopus]|uniref:HMG box domain-containing protein n=1 Tax=Favolaschia claudopus TaxID=2862362 RepID=A0AAW0ABQ4_9AGAR